MSYIYIHICIWLNVVWFFIRIEHYWKPSGSCHHGSVVNEPDQHPWRHGFNPWPRSVGWESGAVVSWDPELLWLWHRLVAVAPIWHIAWEPPCAEGAALKRQKRKKKIFWISVLSHFPCFMFGRTPVLILTLISSYLPNLCTPSEFCEHLRILYARLVIGIHIILTKC